MDSESKLIIEENYPFALGFISAIIIYNKVDSYNIVFCLDNAFIFKFIFCFSIFFSFCCLLYLAKNQKNNSFIKEFDESDSLFLFIHYIMKNVICCLMGLYFWHRIDNFTEFGIYDFILLSFVCCGFFTTWRIASLFVTVVNYSRNFK